MELEQLAEEISQMHIDRAKDFSRIAGSLSKSGESGVLIWLSQREGDTYATDIAAHFGLTPGRVANIIKSLERRCWIERRQDAADQRRALIFLTEEGRCYAAEQYAQMNAAHARLVQMLGEEATLQLIQLLRRCLAAAETILTSA